MDELPFWERRRIAKLANELSSKVKKDKIKKELSVFYDMMAKRSPGRCENCGKSLSATIAFHPRAQIAHILPKEHFKSVMSNPLNIWFACLECHTMYDKWLSHKVELMAIIPTLKERLSKFIDKIHWEEKKRIPYYLL